MLEYGPFVGGRSLSALGAFCEVCARAPELLTAEHVAALAEHLAARHAALPSAALRDRPILDAAAGSGRLAHFLGESPHLRGVEVAAADDGSWALATPPFAHVQQLSHEVAVAQLRPAIITCCWMPENTDFTGAWRTSRDVHEYTLIGPAESGLSGLPWDTWGHVPPYLPPGGFDGAELAAMADTDPKKATLLSIQKGYKATQRGELPPFARDGFAKKRLGALSALQICRRDCSPDACGHSETITFTRQ